MQTEYMKHIEKLCALVVYVEQADEIHRKKCVHWWYIYIANAWEEHSTYCRRTTCFQLLP